MRLFACFFCFATLSGCYESHSAPGGGRLDGGDGDSSFVPVDAPFVPRPEAGPFDSGRLDAGRFDGGRFDGGRPRDAGFDAGRPRDAGFDAGRPRDAGFDGGRPRDAGFDGGRPRDAGFDAGRPRDAGPRDAGRIDAGRRSVALRFERGEVLVVADDPRLDMTGDHTLEMWIRARPSGGPNGSIAIKGSRATDRFMYGIGIEGDMLVAGFGRAGLARVTWAPLERGRWVHVALVVDVLDAMTVEVRLLVDGFLAGNTFYPNDLFESVNDAPLVFGGGGYEGDIDEVRLWRSARPASAIRANMFTRVSGGLPGLEAYWPLEERGQLALDHALNGHDAVLGTLTTPDAADPLWIADGAI